MSSPIHAASLVDSALHSPALLDMLELDLSRALIEYVVDSVVDTVDYALGRPSSSARGRTLSRHTEHARFATFVSDVVHKAEIRVPVLLAALVYIDRAKPHIQIALEQWACERVFLGALIVANKYLNDSTLKNVHWAVCTGVFGKRDVGRIEREFLDVLDFELGIAEPDLLAHHSYLMAAVHPRRPARARASRSPPHARALSHWSDDSSDMDVDSASSAASPSPPQTPDSLAALPALPKHAHAHAPARFADARVHAARAPVYAPPAPPRASALQLLHAFPIPLPRFCARTAPGCPPAPGACRPLHHPHAAAHATQVAA